MEDCIFCKIVEKKADADVVFENDKAIAFENINPVAEVHILVIPKIHIETFMDVDDSESIFEMTKVVQEVVKIKNIESGYKLVFNGGKYQYVPHLHWHVLGGKLEDDQDPLAKAE